MKLLPPLRLLGFLLLAGSPAAAAEAVFDKQNFAITAPEGWTEVAEARTGSVEACFASPDKNEIVMVVVTPTGRVGQMDERFVREFDTGVEKGGGGTKTSGKISAFLGLPAYERFGTAGFGERKATTFIRVMGGDGRYYSIQGMDFGGDVAQNKAILASMDTFRFIRPVEPPAPLGFSFGKAFGEHGFAIAVVTVIATLIVLGLAAVASLFKKKKPRLPGEPPPLR